MAKVAASLAAAVEEEGPEEMDDDVQARLGGARILPVRRQVELGGQHVDHVEGTLQELPLVRSTLKWGYYIFHFQCA